MNSIKLVVLCFAMLFTGSLSATSIDNSADDPNTELRNAVSKMMSKVDLSFLKSEESDAVIEFLLTRNNEIVVLDVNTDHEQIDQIVKEKLNYKRVKVDGIKQGEKYKLKITFVHEV